MHKYLLSVFSLVVILLHSCSPTKKISNSNKNKINGSWTLYNVEYSNSKEKFKTFLFGESDLECFKGSQWNFIENNNTGTYTLVSSSNCSGITRQLKWDVIESDGMQFFQFKRIDDQVKAKYITAGYRLQLAMVTENSIQMIQNSSAEGQPINLIYTFVKNNTK